MKFNFKEKMLMSFIALSSTASLISSCASQSISNDTLVVGIDCDYPPFNWNAKNENEFTLPIFNTNEHCDGYDVSITKYLAKELNKPVIVKRIPFEALIVELKLGNINMALGGISPTPKREEEVDFTVPYYESDLAFLIRNDSLNASYQDFGTKNNPASYQELKKLFEGKSLISQATVVEDEFIEKYFPASLHNDPLFTFPQCALNVKQKISFAMIGETPICEAMTNYGDLRVIYCDSKSFLSDEDYAKMKVAIAVKQKNDELKNELTNALNKLSKAEKEKMMKEALLRQDI